MSDLLHTIGLGIGVPAAISLATALIARRILHRQQQRYTAAIAFAAAYCVGYALTRPWAEWLPSRHWHWTVYFAPAAALIGPLVVAEGIHWIERCLLVLLTVVVFAWLLVPSWESLQPPRTLWVPLLAGYLFLLTVLLEPLPRYLTGSSLPSLMALAAAGSAVLIGATVSLTYSKVAAGGAAGLAGCAIGLLFASDRSPVRGLSLSYAALIGGWSFVGCVEPAEPLWGLMIAPAAPLGLWCVTVGPLSRLKGASAAAVQTAIVLAGLGIAAAMVMLPRTIPNLSAPAGQLAKTVDSDR